MSIELKSKGITVLAPAGVKAGKMGIGGELAFELQLFKNATALVFTSLFTNEANHTGVDKFFLGSSFECPRIIRWGVISNKSAFCDWVEGLTKSKSLQIIAVTHGKPILEKPTEVLTEALKTFGVKRTKSVIQLPS